MRSDESCLVEIDCYDDDLFDKHDVGGMERACEHCGSWNFEGELVGQPLHFNICCRNGKLSHLPKIPEPPEELHDLLAGRDVESRKFRERIREYNSALSFVSFGADIKPPPGHGPPVFRIHGAVYHASVALDVRRPTEGKYAQLYLYDHGHALDLRTRRNPELSPKIMESLQTMLEEISPFVEGYRQMCHVARQALDTGVSNICLGFAANTEGDLRRYNKPTTREVAAVFCGDEGAPPSNRDIVIWPKERAAYRVNERNDLIDPLTYALLFPEGTAGWSESLEHRSDKQTKTYKHVTATQFYAYRLMMFGEPGSENYVPHGAGLLFQQYLVDSYCRAEAVRLMYLRTHQAELRSEA